MRAAETFRGIDDDGGFGLSRNADFWAGYMRGLRRNYHGERFGTHQEHTAWWNAADSRDPSRKMRGVGYRAGVTGKMAQKAMRLLAATQYLSEIGQKGGSVRSEKKAASSAANGRLGGRPKKKEEAPK